MAYGQVERALEIKLGSDYPRVQKRYGLGGGEGRADHHGTPDHRRDPEMAEEKADAARAREQRVQQATRADIADATLYSGTHRPLAPQEAPAEPSQ